MQFKKIVPYKIRKLIPMLGLAGATLMMTPGCEKEPIVQHDTTYTWGPAYWDEIWPPFNVYASADSAEVRQIILQCTNETFYGLSDEWLYNNMYSVYAGTSAANQNKIKISGTIDKLTVRDGNDMRYLDWVKARGLNLKFTNLLYKNNPPVDQKQR